MGAVAYTIIIITFLLGACIGSFVNVLIYRIPRKMDFVFGRSVCPACGVHPGALDLIPIVSYVALRGKCRACKARISPRYPLIETLTGALFVLALLRFGLTPRCAVAMGVSAILIAIAFIDIDTMEIPNGLVIALIPLALAGMFAFKEVNLLARGMGFFAISLPMYLLTLIIKNAFGGGDIKLIAVCGFLLGWQNALVAMLIAVMAGGAFGAVLLVGKTDRRQLIAFGPYLCCGIFCALLYGDVWIAAYRNYFFI